MSTPVVEHIAANIKTAIGEITEADGYNQNLTAIRPRRNDFSDIVPKDLVVLVKQADEEESEEKPLMIGQWDQPFVLMAIVLDSDDAVTSIDTRTNQVRADIQKKLLVDPTRGGYAFDTVILPSAEFDDGEGFTGIAVKVVVKYRTKYNDPYTKA